MLSHAFWHTYFQNDRGVVGRVVQVDKHPFTIIGVAPPEFHGTLRLLNVALFVPLVNEGSDLNARGEHGTVSMVMGHLKAGATPAQAIADLNAIGADLEKNYPKDDGNMKFSLAHPGLDYLRRPVQGFLTGLMLLAALILLAACANLGSLFAARATDHSREVALRLALGASRGRILRQLFTEVLLISLVGGAAGLWGSVALLRGLSAWQPFLHLWPAVHVSVTTDARVYGFALLLTLVSGFLFGAVPVRQMLRTDPYEIVKAGSIGRVGRRITPRDLLLACQIAVCGLLVTSSIVAVRGLVRSMHSNFGFDPQNAFLVDVDMAGYSDDKVPAMQKRMIEALEAIPGVESVGMADGTPLNLDPRGSLVFTDKTTDLRPGNAACEADTYKISPGYFRAAGTTLVSGRAFTWHDDKDAPRVAVVNQEFARKVFGAATSAIGGYYKMKDGTRIQVVGIAEVGKYESLTEDPQPALFLPVLQSPSSQTRLVVRSKLDPQQVGPAVRSTLRGLDAALPLTVTTWNKGLDVLFFGPRIATKSLGVLGTMAAMLAVTGIFSMAAYSVSKRLRELGIRVALGAQRKEVLQSALGRALKLLAVGSAAGLVLGILASRVLALIVYQATSRDPLVLTGALLAMALLGLLATWIPARRALSVDPLILLRDE